MPSNHTENYQLSQWVKSDQVKMEDFNADNAKLDAALKAEADARTAGDAALQTALSKKGNVRVEFYTYTGTGTTGAEGPCRISFTKGEPLLILVLGGGRRTLLLYRGSGETTFGNTIIQSSWSSSGVSWYAYNNVADQLNSKDRTYTALMFYKLD